MNAKELLSELTALEKELLADKKLTPKRKYDLITLFKEVRELVRYRVPTVPIRNLEERTFRCQKCGTLFESENDVHEFDVCYVCGQVFKDTDTLLEKLEECKDCTDDEPIVEAETAKKSEN